MVPITGVVEQVLLMPSSIVPRGANNWVDRGEPDLPQLVEVIRHFFGPERNIPEERLAKRRPAEIRASTPMISDRSAFQPATSIDEVLAALDAIVDRAYDERDRLGFFAALYRTVTAAVKAGIAAGSFQDGPRMERLDVTFANRYLDALHCYRSGQRCSRCWQVAFDAARHSRDVIVQHLLLGMNAHINLDLGIAAAEVCPGDALASLEHDFNEINVVLASLETGIEREVCSLSPWIDLLDHIDPNAGRVVANFSIERARECSWRTAQRLSISSGAERDAAISEIDADVALLGHLVERPIGFVINLNLILVRLREVWDVRKIIRTLSGRTPAA